MMKALFALLVALLWAVPAYAADTITFDTSSVNIGSGSSFSVGNNPNRILLVSVVSNGSTAVTAVSYNSVAMTKLDSATYSTGGINGTQSTWYLLAPATGSHTFSITGGNGINMQAWSYYNVDQNAPEANKMTSNAAGTTISGSITTITPNAVVWASTAFRDTNASSDVGHYSTNMTNNRNPADGTPCGGSSAGNMTADSGAVASPGSVTSTQTCSTGTSGNTLMAQVVLKPSGVTASTPSRGFFNIFWY